MPGLTTGDVVMVTRVTDVVRGACVLVVDSASVVVVVGAAHCCVLCMVNYYPRRSRS